MAKPDGGPAFPQPDSEYRPAVNPEGMSLRDYFAGQALCAMTPGLEHAFLSLTLTHDGYGLLIQNAAALSYRLADAMIAERD